MQGTLRLKLAYYRHICIHPEAFKENHDLAEKVLNQRDLKELDERIVNL
jgi:hypothetical protein